MSEQKSAQLVIGQRVQCVLYGGRTGTIYEIIGEQRPETVGSIFGGIGVRGGNARINVVWDGDDGLSDQLPESLVRGSVQWTVLDEVLAPEAIQDRIDHAHAVVARKAEEAANEKAQFAIEVARLKGAHPGLIQPDRDTSSQSAAVKNIRTELKTMFPGVKFSVRQDRGVSAIDVRWDDGPTGRQVNAIILKYKQGHFNGMDDMYEYERSPWTEAFGGAQYVNARRTVSDEVCAAAYDVIRRTMPGNMADFPKTWAECEDRWRTIPDMGRRDSIGEVVRWVASAWDGFADRWIADLDLPHSWGTVFRDTMEEINRALGGDAEPQSSDIGMGM